jgi:hypothetical protein
MKIKALLPLALIAIALASCAGIDSDPTSSKTVSQFTVSALWGKTNEVDFASKFDDTQFVIEDSNNTQVATVTSAMVSGFDTTQAKFAENLTAKVAYSGQNLDLVYVIKAHYMYEDVTAVLHNDKTVEISTVNGASSLTNYSIPDVVSALPEPANAWPVTILSATGFTDKLETLQLNKTVTTLSSSDLGHFTRVIPANSGAMTFDNGFLLDSSNYLYGLDASLSGNVTLPSTTAMVASCAFAKANTTITSIRIPANVKIGLEAGVASYNLTSLASFVALEGSSYINGAHGTLLWSSSAGKATILIPPALEGFSLTNPFVFEDTVGVGRLDSLYKHTAIPAISLPSTVTSLTSNVSLKDVLQRITLTNSEKVVTVAASTLANFSSTIEIKVPASLLSSYQEADGWKTIAANISAI